MLSLIGLIVFKILLPVVLLIAIYLGYMEFRGLFQKSMLDTRVVGLLVVGSLVGTISDMPIFISPNYLLALNIGGGLVPVFLSFYFLKNKKLGLAVVGIFIVALVTFFVTRYEPNVGIVSELHYSLLPPFTAVVISLAIHKRDVINGAPFCYAVATLGTLIGADIFHLPELFLGGKFMGAIGGAGVYDMVFISGLLSMCVVFLFAKRADRKAERSYTEEEIANAKIQIHFRNAEEGIYQGKYQDALNCAYNAVVERILFAGRKRGLKEQEPIRILEIFTADYTIRYNFFVLSQEIMRTGLSFNDATHGIKVATHMIEGINKAERAVYASTRERILAYTIDLIIIIFAVLFSMYFCSLIGLYTLGELFSMSSYWSIAWVMIAVVVQMLYFTFFEYVLCASPGKLLLKVKVVNEESSQCDFMGAFTRNIIRTLDLILLYIPSVVMIEISSKRQRIGDYIAKTAVVKLSNRENILFY